MHIKLCFTLCVYEVCFLYTRPNVVSSCRIINGFVEAMVSFRRLSVVLVDSSRSSQKGGGFSDEGSDPPGDMESAILSSVVLRLYSYCNVAML